MTIPNAKYEKLRILIIDDDEIFCHIYKTLLEEIGKYQVEIANNGHDGIVLARGMEPDVILLDIIMPDMDGNAVACLLSCEESTNNIPYIFITSILIPHHEIGIGINNPCLRKPLDMEDLIYAIEEARKHEKH